MREGLSTAGASSVFAAHDGTVWVGNFQAVDFLRGDTVSAIREGRGLPGRNVTTLFEDHAGRLWLGIDRGLWVYNQGVFRAIRHADGTGLGIIFSITEDIDHSIWVRAGPYLDRIEDTTLREEVTSPQISTAYIVTADPGGGILLGLVNGDLVRYQPGKTSTLPAPAGERPRQIRDLLAEPDGSVWGTNLDGLIRWKDGMRRELGVLNGLPCDGIYALVKDDRGNIWLPSRCGLIVIDKPQLDAWWERPERTVQTRLIDVFDGVQPGLTSLKPQIVRTPDGRLWFVNSILLQMVDPDHLPHNSLPPPVHIEGITANREQYQPEDGLRLPPKIRDLQIDYTALSFVVPQKVRFRYKLEGHDTTWQEVGTRRQAFYTNLPPGNYSFQVRACNNDGVWNETGAALAFGIAPAWYQTWTFLLLSAATVLLLLWAFYQLRIRQVAAAMGARFDERLGERTRLARELHDTLLQTIQACKMVADDAFEGSDPARMRRAIERLSDWLAQAIREGRATLNALRTSTTQTNDLGQSFRRATEDVPTQSAMQVELSVHGEPREMHPIVRDEVYRIGYEAIRNAEMHSQASRLEVELRYTQDLALRISDNGCGIDSGAMKDGHFGLVGMRERAERIGGKLTLVSSPASGTEITLVVPGRLIFRGPGPGQRTVWEKIKAQIRRINETSVQK
jgi:signal transduction histidine kinase